MTIIRYFVDTEFMEDGNSIVLLSIGAVDHNNGRLFYAENSDANWNDGNEFVKEHVIPKLTGPANQATWLHRSEIADLFKIWVLAGGGTPEFWGYYADYDWVTICQMYGAMVDRPEGWPMYMLDIKQLAYMIGDPELPKQERGEHNALDDAMHNQFMFEFLMAQTDLSFTDSEV